MHAGNRCWQILTSRPRATVNQQTGRTRKIQREAFLIDYNPSQLIQRTWRPTCLHVPLQQRSQTRKVTLQKWRYKKRKHSVHAYSRKNQKRPILRSEKHGDLITAEHRVLNEGRESRDNHRYAVVVQVLATQRNPCQTKTSQNTGKNLRKFTDTVAEDKSYSHVQFIRIWQVLWRIIMESSNNYTSSIRDISRIIEIWIGWKGVVGFYEMMLLSARWPRPPSSWEISS